METAHDLVKKQFLIRLNDKDFRNLCQVDKSFANLCSGPSSEDVYYERSKWWFGENLLQFRESNMTWKEFYNRISDFINKENGDYYIYKLYKNGKLMEIKILYYMKINPSESEVNISAERGQLQVLKWAALLNPPILPNKNGALCAGENGYTEVVIWLVEKGIYPT